MLRALIDVPVEPEIADGLAGLVELMTVDPQEVRRDLPRELLEEAEVLFCMQPPLNFEHLRKLRWVQLSSAGYSQILGLGLAERGVKVTNGRGCFDVPIAEWNVAMMVNLARSLRQMIRNQEQAVWDRGAEFQREIRGMRVGLWGYGGIGRETARLAKQMGLEVWVLSRGGIQPALDVYCVAGTGDPEAKLPDRVFLKGQEREFLAGLDFLIVAMPLTPATEGLIGADELRALPRSAFVLNPARGPIIRQEALLQALREGWIAGAALDTHYQYPLPPEHPLWSFPNVILTPHISGSSLSQHFRRRIWEIFGENVRRFANGSGRLLNELTVDQVLGR
jgi:phosphoglycerate dehydrogenase-like enzyme